MENMNNGLELKDFSDALLSQTAKKSVTWECFEYFHPSFIKKSAIFSDIKNESDIILVHSGEFFLQTENRIYSFGFHEGMDISGDMSVHGVFAFEVFDLNETPLYSFEVHIDDDSPADEHNLFKLTHEICTHSSDWIDSVYYEYTDKHIDLFLYNSLDAPKIKPSFKKQPLPKLVERLIIEKRIEDFHRLLHEPEYRERLLNEQKEEK